MKRLIAFLKDEEGATAIEYGLMVAAIAGVIITIVITLGGQVNSGFTAVSGNFPGSVGP